MALKESDNIIRFCAARPHLKLPGKRSFPCCLLSTGLKDRVSECSSRRAETSKLLIVPSWLHSILILMENVSTLVLDSI